MALTEVKKHAVRVIHAGKSRSYILFALDTVDAICAALDLLECDVPDIGGVAGLAIISKPYPEGAALAMEGDGPVIDTTRIPVATPGNVELAAA